MSAPLVALDSRAGRIVLTTTVLGSAVAMLTATVVNVALPTIARDLDATTAGQQWVVNAYLLTLASLILIGGSLGDRFGRLRIYRLGLVWFAIASIACAIAPSIEILIVCRLLQGIGAALLTPGSLAILETTLTEDDRGRAIGLWSGLGGIAGAVGPLVGGVLVEASWRWVFVINLPVAAVVAALSLTIEDRRDPDAADAPIDVVGAALTILLLGGVSYALIDGPPATRVVAAVAAVVALVGLFLYEPRQDHAMLPLDLFSIATFAAANAVTLLVYGGMGLVFFLLTIHLQVAAGWSALAAGTALLPVTAIMLVLSSRAGDLARRIGPRIPLTVGPLTMALAMVLLSRIGPDASYVADVLPATIVFGLGLAACVAPVTSAALGSIPDNRAGAASGMNSAIARTGQLIAVAAIPPLVGLGGDALGDPEALADGFGPALWVAAGIVASGGVLAAVVMPASVPQPGRRSTHDHATASFHCHVDGPPSSTREHEPATT